LLSKLQGASAIAVVVSNMKGKILSIEWAIFEVIPIFFNYTV